jgi:hypothetical protein
MGMKPQALPEIAVDLFTIACLVEVDILNHLIVSILSLSAVSRR